MQSSSTSSNRSDGESKAPLRVVNLQPNKFNATGLGLNVGPLFVYIKEQRYKRIEGIVSSCVEKYGNDLLPLDIRFLRIIAKFLHNTSELDDKNDTIQLLKKMDLIDRAKLYEKFVTILTDLLKEKSYQQVINISVALIKHVKIFAAEVPGADDLERQMLSKLYTLLGQACSKYNYQDRAKPFLIEGLNIAKNKQEPLLPDSNLEELMIYPHKPQLHPVFFQIRVCWQYANALNDLNDNAASVMYFKEGIKKTKAALKDGSVDEYTKSILITNMCAMRFALANSYNAKGDFSEALNQLTSVIDFTLSNNLQHIAWFYLMERARFYLKTNDKSYYTRACQDYEAATLLPEFLEPNDDSTVDEVNAKVAQAGAMDTLKKVIQKVKTQQYHPDIIRFSEIYIKYLPQNSAAYSPAKTYYDIAKSHIALKKYEEALLAIDKAIHSEANNDEFYFLRAEIHFHLKNYTAALSDLKTVESLIIQANSRVKQLRALIQSEQRELNHSAKAKAKITQTDSSSQSTQTDTKPEKKLEPRQDSEVKQTYSSIATEAAEVAEAQTLRKSIMTQAQFSTLCTLNKKLQEMKTSLRIYGSSVLAYKLASIKHPKQQSIKPRDIDVQVSHIHPDNKEEVISLFKRAGFIETNIKPDYMQLKRVIDNKPIEVTLILDEKNHQNYDPIDITHCGLIIKNKNGRNYLAFDDHSAILDSAFASGHFNVTLEKQATCLFSRTIKYSNLLEGILGTCVTIDKKPLLMAAEEWDDPAWLNGLRSYFSALIAEGDKGLDICFKELNNLITKSLFDLSKADNIIFIFAEQLFKPILQDTDYAANNMTDLLREFYKLSSAPLRLVVKAIQHIIINNKSLQTKYIAPTEFPALLDQICVALTPKTLVSSTGLSLYSLYKPAPISSSNPTTFIPPSLNR